MSNETSKPTEARELPSDDEISNYATEKYSLYAESVRDVAFESGALWMRSKASDIIASQQSEIERLKQWNDSANERTEFWKNECDIAVNIAMRSQDKNKQLEAELKEVRAAIKKAMKPENIECDGSHCQGCYKDILRPYIQQNT